MFDCESRPAVGSIKEIQNTKLTQLNTAQLQSGWKKSLFKDLHWPGLDPMSRPQPNSEAVGEAKGNNE